MLRLTSIVLLTVFSSIALHNAFQIADYALNYQKISEELCENKDDEISQCNGLCYLSDQIVETTPVNNAFDLSNLRVSLSFLFYFFNSEVHKVECTPLSQSTVYTLVKQLSPQFISEIPVPPPASI